MPISVRTVIPSLTYRVGAHPLMSIAQSIGLIVDSVLKPGSMLDATAASVRASSR